MKKLIPFVFLLASCSTKMVSYHLDKDTASAGMDFPRDSGASVSAQFTDVDGEMVLMMSRYATKEQYLKYNKVDAVILAGGKPIEPHRTNTSIYLSKSEIETADYSAIKKEVQRLPAPAYDMADIITTSYYIGKPSGLPDILQVKLLVVSDSASKDTMLVFHKMEWTKSPGRMY